MIEKNMSINDVEQLMYLVNKYETSNRGPGFVSSGRGDVGGISYGKPQFSSTVGVVNAFVNWLCTYPDPALANYGKVLNLYEVNSAEFINLWQEIGDIDPGNFGKLQDEYTINQYYHPVITRFRAKFFNIEKHSQAMKPVIMSRSVQNGPSGVIRLFELVCEETFEYPNLSYVDAKNFDEDFITEVYNFLIDECDNVYYDSYAGFYQSPYKFCHGSSSVIYGLKSRFINEKIDALNLLQKSP